MADKWESLKDFIGALATSYNDQATAYIKQGDMRSWGMETTRLETCVKIVQEIVRLEGLEDGRSKA